MVQQEPARAPAHQPVDASRSTSPRSVAMPLLALPGVVEQVARSRARASMLPTIAVGRVVVERGAGARQADQRRARRAPSIDRQDVRGLSRRARRRSGRRAPAAAARPSGGARRRRRRPASRTRASSMLDRLRQLGEDRPVEQRGQRGQVVALRRRRRWTCAVAARATVLPQTFASISATANSGLPLERQSSWKVPVPAARRAAARPRRCRAAAAGAAAGCARGRSRCAGRGRAS